MANAIVYTRVGDVRKIDDSSLAGQERVCRAWCRVNNLRVAHVFVETGKSASSADRPQFQAMFKFLTLAVKGSISHVIVHKFDRFSRNAEDEVMYRSKLRLLGIDLLSATEPMDDSVVSKFLTTIMSALEQFDNDTRQKGEGK